MPYKDIKNRRLAYKKWSRNNREKRNSYNRILRIAKKNNPVPEECYIDGCKFIGERHHPDYSKPEEIVWICRSHHRRIEHSSKCIICGEKSVARSLCNRHYKSERQKIDPEYKERVRISKIRK